MRPMIFPPSANWFHGSICDYVDVEGTSRYAYGAKGNIVVVNPEDNDVLKVYHAHGERVSGVKYIYNSLEMSLMLASVGHDGYVKLWNAFDYSLFTSHKHHENNEVTCVIQGNDNHTLITGDNSGLVVCFDWLSNSNKKIKLSNSYGSISVLALSPYHHTQLVIGCSNGSLNVLDLSSRTVVIRLPGHTSDIQSMLFRPVEFYGGGDMSSWRAPPLLLSSSSDECIKLWNASTWELVVTLKLPACGGGLTSLGSQYQGGKKITSRQMERLWLAAMWQQGSAEDDMCIMSSAYVGELIQWKWLWPPVKNVILKPTLFSCHHDKPIFCIIPQRSLGDPMNLTERGYSSSNFITVSMDRSISQWNMSSSKTVKNLPGIGGFVQALDISPHNTNLLAIGTGDNSIRLWKTSSSSSDDKYNHKVLWKGIQDKITAVSFCPFVDGLLAYGSNDGRVGVINVHTSEHASTSRPPHCDAILKVGWRASKIEDLEDRQLFIFSLGKLSDKSSDGGGLLMETTVGSDGIGDGAIKGASANLNVIISRRCGVTNGTTIKISNFDIQQHPRSKPKLVVGCRDGSVYLLQVPDGSAHDLSVGGSGVGEGTNSYILLASFREHAKLISALRFGNTSTNYENWFAAGDTGGKVTVHNFSSTLSGRSEDPKSAKTITLPGHTSGGVISCLSWGYRGRSTHKGDTESVSAVEGENVGVSTSENLLASSSFDGTSQVWDVASGAPFGNCRLQENARVLSVTWSRSAVDFLFAGSEDQTVVYWNYRDATELSPPVTSLVVGSATTAKKKTTGKKKTSVPTGVPPVSSSGDPSAGDEAKGGGVSKKRNQDLSHGSMTLLSGSHSLIGEAPIDSLKAVSLVAAKNRSSLFLPIAADFPLPETTTNKCLEEAIFMVQTKFMNTPSGIPGSPGIVSPTLKSQGSLLWEREDALRMLRGGIISYNSCGSYSAAAALSVWLGDLCGAFELVIQAKALSPLWVSLAPAAGMDIWASLVRLYALQLEDQKDYHGAVLYHLAVHDVSSAIRVYESASLFADAVAIARARLPPTDSTIATLLKNWGDKLYKNGDFPDACRTYVSSGNFIEATACASRVPLGISSSRACTLLTMLSDRHDGAGNESVKWLYEYIRLSLTGDVTQVSWRMVLDMICAFPAPTRCIAVPLIMEIHLRRALPSVAFATSPALSTTLVLQPQLVPLLSSDMVIHALNHWGTLPSLKEMMDVVSTPDFAALYVKDLHPPTSSCFAQLALSLTQLLLNDTVTTTKVYVSCVLVALDGGDETFQESFLGLKEVISSIHTSFIGEV